jgi:hypothetical protein
MSRCLVRLAGVVKEQVPSDDVKRLWAEADELLAMTVQSIRTARGDSR